MQIIRKCSIKEKFRRKKSESLYVFVQIFHPYRLLSVGVITIFKKVEESEVQQGYTLIRRFLNESKIDCYFGKLSGLRQLICRVYGECITDQEWQGFLTKCFKESINKGDHSSECLVLVRSIEGIVNLHIETLGKG